MSFTDAEILSQLEKTADGEYITPQTELWQIDPESMIEDGKAWRVDNVYSYQRLVDYPVFSSEAAAKRSIRSASQVAADRIKDLESHIIGLQVKAENDAKLIKQQVDQIKALQEALHEQRNLGERDSSEIARKCVLIESLKKELAESQELAVDLQNSLNKLMVRETINPDTYDLACWAAKHEVTLTFYRRYSHIPYNQDTDRAMVMGLHTPEASSTQLISRGDNVPSIGKLFQDALMSLRDVQESLKG